MKPVKQIIQEAKPTKTPGKPTKGKSNKPNKRKIPFVWSNAPSEEEVKSGSKFLKIGMKGDFVKKLQSELNTVTKTISTIQKEIALVEEYKTALIAEAVTGKIDIRDFKVPSDEMPLAMVAEEAANYNKQ